MPAARTVSRSDVVSFRVNAGGSTATSTAVQGVTEGCDERLMQARQVRQADDGRDEEWRRAWQEKRQKVAASGRRATHWGWEGTALGRNVTTAINTGTNLWYVKVQEGGTRLASKNQGCEDRDDGLGSGILTPASTKYDRCNKKECGRDKL